MHSLFSQTQTASIALASCAVRVRWAMDAVVQAALQVAKPSGL